VRLSKVHFITIAFIGILASNPTYAANFARLQVAATVIPFVSLNATQHVTTTYEIKSEDLIRGHIDPPNSMTVNVKTNLNGGVPVYAYNRGSGRIPVMESGYCLFTDASRTVIWGDWTGCTSTVTNMVTKNSLGMPQKRHTSGDCKLVNSPSPPDFQCNALGAVPSAGRFNLGT